MRELYPHDGLSDGYVLADQNIVDVLAEWRRVVIDIQKLYGHYCRDSQGRRSTIKGLDIQEKILAELIVKIIRHRNDAWNHARYESE